MSDDPRRYAGLTPLFRQALEFTVAIKGSDNDPVEFLESDAGKNFLHGLPQEEQVKIRQYSEAWASTMRTHATLNRIQGNLSTGKPPPRNALDERPIFSAAMT